VNISHKCRFERSVLASGLLTEAQLGEAWAAIERSQRDSPGSTAVSPDQQLAAKLVELGWLNPWQAKQLSEGRTDFGLGIYRVVDSIGRGGMGEVYKAEHPVLGRLVAIKVLRRKKSSPEDVANFLRESRVLARLDHENLVRAFDAGEWKNVYFLVTEYVPGADLRKFVRAKGPLGMAQAANIISQVAVALQHAHEQGLVHRDVKPGNVLVTPDGRAKLSDLGLAGPLQGVAEEDPRLGKIVGTPDYVSPDHIEAPWHPTPAWDVYSLGCTLFYAVTGKVPFPGGSTNEKIIAHLQRRPLNPRRFNPQLSDRFVDVIADMMAKNPADRIASAKEVADRLSPWVDRPAQSAPWNARPASPGADDPRKPEASDTSFDVSARAEVDSLDDTQGSLSAIHESLDSPHDLPGLASQATHPVAVATEETFTALRRTAGGRTQPTAVLGPFAVLVLFPLAVVAAILLAGWAARLLF
jgi:eukaryotic-like serine/threonine-protein kinase